MEDQVFLLLYDLAPPSPPPTLLPLASCLSFSDFLYVAGRAYWWERGVGGGGGGAISYDDEKDWSSINHSILSVWESLPSGLLNSLKIDQMASNLGCLYDCFFVVKFPISHSRSETELKINRRKENNGKI